MRLVVGTLSVLGFAALACGGSTQQTAPMTETAPGPQPPAEVLPPADVLPPAASRPGTPEQTLEDVVEAHAYGHDFACALCGIDQDRLIASVRASSALEEDGRVYGAALAFDGDPTTAWCEGVEGAGVGEWIEVRFARETHVEGFYLSNGFFKSRQTLERNGRVRLLAIALRDVAVDVRFADPTVFVAPDEHGPKVAGAAEWFTLTREHPAAVNLSYRVDPGAHEPLRTDTIRFTISDVFAGAKHDDTCITDIDMTVGDIAEWKTLLE